MAIVGKEGGLMFGKGRKRRCWPMVSILLDLGHGYLGAHFMRVG